MNATLIVNPTAGRGRGEEIADVAQAALAEGGWTLERVATEGPGHATELAARAAEAGAELVLACGGDGTLCQVIEGLFDTGIPAAQIPAGTGNDFARTIGLDHDPAAAARQLLQGAPHPVDLMHVLERDIHAVNIVGLGFDSAVAARINRRKRWVGGRAAYFASVLQELIVHRPTEVKVTVGDEVWEGKALLVAVANAKSYGAGMMIAPRAEISDGILDIVVVAAAGKLEFLRSLPLVMRGEHAEHPLVSMFRGTRVRVETLEPTPVLVDGDIETTTPLTVEVIPGRATLWLPERAPVAE